MARPKEPPRIERRGGRRKWYIRDGDSWISTGSEDEGPARQVLADYVRLQAEGECQTVSGLLDARLESLRGKARYEVVRYLIPRLKAHFGPLRPDQVDENTIAAYVAMLPGKGRSDLEELKAALPEQFKKSVKLPATGAPRSLFLTGEQQVELLAAASRFHVRLFIIIALNTGARHGAILDLTWDRVAPDFSWVDFNDPAKPVTNKRRVVVPCSPELRAALSDACDPLDGLAVVGLGRIGRYVVGLG